MGMNEKNSEGVVTVSTTILVSISDFPFSPRQVSTKLFGALEEKNVVIAETGGTLSKDRRF